MNWKDCITELRKTDPLFALEVERTAILRNFVEDANHTATLQDIALFYPDDGDFAVHAIKLAENAAANSENDEEFKTLALKLAASLEKTRSNIVGEDMLTLLLEGCTCLSETSVCRKRRDALKRLESSIEL